MRITAGTPRCWVASMTVTLVIFAAGCGSGGKHALVDSLYDASRVRTASQAPTVTAVAPGNDAVGVPLNDSIAAEFTEPMNPISGAASFTVNCAAPCTSPEGIVALDAGGANATFTPSANLEPLTLYTVTITEANSEATGLALASPYVWQFTTGTTLDTSRPAVQLTVPATTPQEPTNQDPTTGAPINSAIIAAFTEDMAPSTISGASFTVTCAAPCVSPTGAVRYEVGSKTAVFTPTDPLEVSTTYTATIATAATDLAGNALGGNQAPLPAAGDDVWTFTTAAAPAPVGNVTVDSTNPDAIQQEVCPNASVDAMFAVHSGLRMNPSTLNTATFTLTGPYPAATAVTAASVSLDAATGTIATFTPQAALTSGTYTATLLGGANGVKDLAIPANGMPGSVSWTFTVGNSTGNCVAPPLNR
jgi:hypothetical protein